MHFGLGFGVLELSVQSLRQAPSVRDLLQAPARVTVRMGFAFGGSGLVASDLDCASNSQSSK